MCRVISGIDWSPMQGEEEEEEEETNCNCDKQELSRRGRVKSTLFRRGEDRQERKQGGPSTGAASSAINEVYGLYERQMPSRNKEAITVLSFIFYVIKCHLHCVRKQSRRRVGTGCDHISFPQTSMIPVLLCLVQLYCVGCRKVTENSI